MNPTLPNTLARLVKWVELDALPLWLGRARSSEDWFHSQLSAIDGEPSPQTLILLPTQAQMMYVIARAEQLGWITGYSELAKYLAVFAGRYGVQPCRSDGYIYALSSLNMIVDSRLDLTNHAFHVLSNAALYCAYDDKMDLRRAYNIAEWLNLHFTAPNGGWVEGNYAVETRLSRSHRQMLVAFLALYEAAAKPLWEQRAKQIVQLFVNRFLIRESRCIAEHFDSNWAVKTCGVRKWNAQEHFAWIHALNCYEQLLGNEELPLLPLYEEGVRRLQLRHADKESASRASECAALSNAVSAGLGLIKSGASHLESIVNQFAMLLLNQLLQVDGNVSFKDGRDAHFGSAESLMRIVDAAAEAKFYLENRGS